MTLDEYLAQHNPASWLAQRTGQGVVPRPHYFKDGDFVEWYWSDACCYAEPILIEGLEVGTVMRSQETKEAVGVQIFGIARLLEASCQ